MKIISRLTFSLIIFLNINIVLAENNKKVSVTNLWIKEAPPTVSVLVAYAKLKNNTDTSLSLTSIESPFFSSIEIHRSIIKNDTASMERHTTLEIPSKATVELAPGDFHLMLFIISVSICTQCDSSGNTIDSTSCLYFINES